jgi:hypothetical protein
MRELIYFGVDVNDDINSRQIGSVMEMLSDGGKYDVVFIGGTAPFVPPVQIVDNLKMVGDV